MSNLVAPVKNARKMVAGIWNHGNRLHFYARTAVIDGFDHIIPAIDLSEVKSKLTRSTATMRFIPNQTMKGGESFQADFYFPFFIANLEPSELSC